MRSVTACLLSVGTWGGRDLRAQAESLPGADSKSSDLAGSGCIIKNWVLLRIKELPLGKLAFPRSSSVYRQDSG